MERRIRLGELLIRAGLITELQLNAALAEQKKWGGRLGRILVDMKFISEDILVKGLSRLLGVPIADLKNLAVPESITKRFDAMDCQNRGYLPVSYNATEKKLSVAMVDVQDLELVDALRFEHGVVVQPLLAGEHALLDANRALFYGAAITEGEESGFKLINNQGSTLVKDRQEIFGDQPLPRQVTGVEQSPLILPTQPGVSSQVQNFESAQKRQSRAIKTLLELLIQKGVFTREEFMAFVNQQNE